MLLQAIEQLEGIQLPGTKPTTPAAAEATQQGSAHCTGVGQPAAVTAAQQCSRHGTGADQPTAGTACAAGQQDPSHLAQLVQQSVARYRQALQALAASLPQAQQEALAEGGGAGLEAQLRAEQQAALPEFLQPRPKVSTAQR